MNERQDASAPQVLRIDDPIPPHNATYAYCALCAGVCNVSEKATWAPVGEKGTLRIVHAAHFLAREHG